MPRARDTVVSYFTLVVAMGGTAYAAAGGAFILGHNNSAGATTSLTNTRSGPALKLGTHSGATPPLAGLERHQDRAPQRRHGRRFARDQLRNLASAHGCHSRG